MNPRTLASASLVALLPVLSACGAGPHATLIDSGMGQAQVAKVADGWAVTSADGHSAPLTGYSEARLSGFLSSGTDRILLVDGKTGDCEKALSWVSVRATEIAATRIGLCGESYQFGGDGATVTAMQVGAEDPKMYIYRDGASTGPVLQSSLQPQAPEPVQHVRHRRAVKAARHPRAARVAVRQEAAASHLSSISVSAVRLESVPQSSGMRTFSMPASVSQTSAPVRRSFDPTRD